jgi:HAE1 family hydrophobic/amphiphilic exporter-1
VQIAKRVLDTIKKIEKELPGGIHIKVVYDQSQFIREALSGVMNSAVQGGGLAFLVLFLFLQSIAHAAIVSTAIPISIMATIALMYFTGLSLNTISLGGLALGIGMLVDSAIVVVENIYRLGKEGDLSARREVAARGTEEVASAIWGVTLTTIAVFFPIVFATGVAGQLFKELSYTVCFSVGCSMIVALTLIPVLAALLGGSTIKWTFLNRLNQWGAQVAEAISHSVRLSLRHRGILILVTMILFGGSAWLLTRLDRQFLPKIDQRQFSMKVDLPTGMRLEVTDEAIHRIEGHLASFPEVKDCSVTIGSSKDAAVGQVAETLGVHQAQILVNLYKKREKKEVFASTDEVVARLKRLLESEARLKEAQIEYVVGETTMTSGLGGGQPVEVEIRGNDLMQMKSISENLMAQMGQVSGLFGIKSSLPPAHPETKAQILRDRASLYNLSVRDIAETTQIAIKGKVATKFKEGGKEIDIRVRLNETDRQNLSQLRTLFMHSPLGVEVPLSEVAYISEGFGPSEIRRLEGERVILVSAGLIGKNLRQSEEEIQLIIEKMEIPKKVFMKISGEGQQVRESFATLFWALLLSVVLVYMIMASEFESLWQPMVIMVTVPLSVIGVAWTLFLLHIPLSVMVFLGMIVLGGVVVDNGIVLLEFVEDIRRQQNQTIIEEILVNGIAVRLRPILMTGLTTILGLIPLAVGLGEGAELQAPMAWTVIGGMISATFLTLFVVPAIYLSFDGAIQKFKKK